MYFNRQQGKPHKILIFCIQVEHLVFSSAQANSYSKPNSVSKQDVHSENLQLH